MRTAFKEWAAVCRALGTGRQTVILRKGGIAESGGRFIPEYPEFLLFPTHLHQSKQQLVPDASELFDETTRAPNPADHVLIEFLSKVVSVANVTDPERLAALAPEHIWTEAVVRERFDRWRSAGVHALLVRVFRLPQPRAMVSLPAYAGCKSWVRLEEDIPTEGATAVLSDAEFAQRAGPLATVFGCQPIDN